MLQAPQRMVHSPDCLVARPPLGRLRTAAAGRRQAARRRVIAHPDSSQAAQPLCAALPRSDG